MRHPGVNCGAVVDVPQYKSICGELVNCSKLVNCSELVNCGELVTHSKT